MADWYSPDDCDPLGPRIAGHSRDLEGVQRPKGELERHAEGWLMPQHPLNTRRLMVEVEVEIGEEVRGIRPVSDPTVGMLMCLPLHRRPVANGGEGGQRTAAKKAFDRRSKQGGKGGK